jgi:hypothetical protein
VVIDISLNDAASVEYTDVIPGEKVVDKQSQHRLQVLLKSLTSHRKSMPSEDRPVFHSLQTVTWLSSGLAPDASDEHAAYLQCFRQTVIMAVTRIIERGLTSYLQVGVGRETESLKIVDREVAACMYVEQVSRRDSIKDKVKVKVADAVDEALRQAVSVDMESEGGHRAVLIRGPEGCGKSAALLRAIDVISTFSSSSSGGRDELVVIPRLILGFGKTSFDLLADIVLQLTSIVSRTMSSSSRDQQPSGQSPPFEFDRLVQAYASLLRQFSESAVLSGDNRRRLVIAIDGLENVRLTMTTTSSTIGNLDWLSTALPSRVHVFATYKTQFDPSFVSPISASGKRRIIDVPDLDETGIARVVNETFSRLGRRMATDQDGVASLMEAARVQPRPLFVELLAEECAARDAAMTSRSKSPNSCRNFEKLTSVENITKVRLKRIEKLFGRCVFCSLLF